MTDHLAGCAYREVKAYRHIAGGTIVDLVCGHSHFTGKHLTRPTRRQCLTSPCYQPQKEFA